MARRGLVYTNLLPDESELVERHLHLPDVSYHNALRWTRKIPEIKFLYRQIFHSHF